MQKIKDFYVNGVFEKRVERYTPDVEKKEIGEILTYPKFDDLIYSDKQKEFIKLAIEKIKSKCMNLLFSGYAGTGKTFSTKMIAVETGRKYVYLNGNLNKDKMIEVMRNIDENSLVCIDEIHNLREATAEIIYPAIEYGEISYEGNVIKLNNLVFVGTTTEPEKLPKPLLDRFMRIEFEEPSEEIMSLILEKRGLSTECIQKLLNFTINIRTINKIIDYIELYGEKTMENLVKVFRLMKINLYSGLSDEQEKYMDYLKKVGRAGVRNLSLVLKRSENYIKLDIEPDLIRKEMIMITSRGREISPEFKDVGYSQLKQESEKNHVKFTKEERDIAVCWLKNNKNVTEKLGKRYFELVNQVAETIHDGIDPEEID